MTRWNIIVAAFDRDLSAADGIKRRLQAAWSIEPEPSFTLSSVEDLRPPHLAQPAAVVLVCDYALKQTRVLPFLTALEEASVGVLALLDGKPGPSNPFDFAGALVLAKDTNPAVICATLKGMLHRQQTVVHLRREAALARRSHGGIEGEIARMHEELQLAAIVQRDFLPRKIPKLHGVEFAALWRPTSYVSGDIYDISRLDHDHIGVFIADAVGHGVPAALMTMVIARSLTMKEIGYSSYRIIPPSEVLAQLNADLIQRQGRTTRFATAVYALVNCRSRVVCLAGAGHPPPIYLPADRPSELLETSGGLLGVFEDETYEQIELDLAVDDRILFHSDGFEQAFPPARADSYQRRLPTKKYREEFERLTALTTATEMVEAIGRRIDSQSGSLHLADDLSLICLHAGPLPTRATDDDKEEVGSVGGPERAPTATP